LDLHAELVLALFRGSGFVRSRSMFKVEAVVIGAGMVGLAIARALTLRGVQVLLLEKEIAPEAVRRRAAAKSFMRGSTTSLRV
jgi:2-polyprenyl-6-methoxyphenol hydroxylase-like FAD-dependent oxidoreductase